MWTVRPVESGYERHLLPQGRLQQPSWETCFSDASIAAAGLAVSMRWNNISGAASTVLRRKARANPDSSVPVAHGLQMNLEHGSSTTMLAPVAIQTSKESKSRGSSHPHCPNCFLPAAVLQWEHCQRCLHCSCR